MKLGSIIFLSREYGKKCNVVLVHYKAGELASNKHVQSVGSGILPRIKANTHLRLH